MNESNKTDPAIEAQRKVFEGRYDNSQCGQPGSLHDTPNPLLRYLRDRRLQLVLGDLSRLFGPDVSSMSLLVVCGGDGGEATFFCNQGFRNVTNSDFSANALDQCQKRDPRFKTLYLNAQKMDLEDSSFDIVLVKDGLHHLPRPVQGFHEMLRVARRAVVVIEPHAGLSAKLLGREWEEHAGVFNFVFRWNPELFRQAAKSQLLKQPMTIITRRLWDHALAVHNLVRAMGSRPVALLAAKAVYSALWAANPFGNQFIGIVVKNG